MDSARVDLNFFPEIGVFCLFFYLFRNHSFSPPNKNKINKTKFVTGMIEKNIFRDCQRAFDFLDCFLTRFFLSRPFGKRTQHKVLSKNRKSFVRLDSFRKRETVFSRRHFLRVWETINTITKPTHTHLQVGTNVLPVQCVCVCSFSFVSEIQHAGLPLSVFFF